MDSILLMGLDESGVAKPIRVNSVDGRLVINETDDSAWEGAGYITWQTETSLGNEKVLGTDIIMSGTLAARPAASLAGRLYLATDVNGGTLYRDSGSTWATIVGGTPIATATTIAHNAVTVDTTVGGTQIVAARADRKRVFIQGDDTVVVYVGVSGVTVANGYPLVGDGITSPGVVLETTAAVYGIVASGSQAVRYLEEYGA